MLEATNGPNLRQISGLIGVHPSLCVNAPKTSEMSDCILVLQFYGFSGGGDVEYVVNKELQLMRAQETKSV